MVAHGEDVVSSPGAFFYGTLLHPKVLKRVIMNDGHHLYVSPAILLEHTRHRIEGEDYPGILPYASSRHLFDHGLSSEERSVRGTLVWGLNEADFKLLDDFEGDEYVRRLVSVHPLHQPVSLNNSSVISIPMKPPALEEEKLLPATSAYTYIWINPTDRVAPELWSYETFMKDNAWKWTGEFEETDGSEGNMANTLKGTNGGDELAGIPSDRTVQSGGSNYFSRDQVERRRLRSEK